MSASTKFYYQSSFDSTSPNAHTRSYIHRPTLEVLGRQAITSLSEGFLDSLYIEAHSYHPDVPRVYFKLLLDCNRPGLSNPNTCPGIIGLTIVPGSPSVGEYHYAFDTSNVRLLQEQGFPHLHTASPCRTRHQFPSSPCTLPATGVSTPDTVQALRPRPASIVLSAPVTSPPQLNIQRLLTRSGQTCLYAISGFFNFGLDQD